MNYHPIPTVGYVTRIALHPTRPRLCVDVLSPYPSLLVFDVLTGKTPPAGALVVAQGHHSASAHGVPSVRDSTLRLQAPMRQEGRRHAGAPWISACRVRGTGRGARRTRGRGSERAAVTNPFA